MKNDTDRPRCGVKDCTEYATTETKECVLLFRIDDTGEYLPGHEVLDGQNSEYRCDKHYYDL